MRTGRGGHRLLANCCSYILLANCNCFCSICHVMFGSLIFPRARAAQQAAAGGFHPHRLPDTRSERTDRLRVNCSCRVLSKFVWAWQAEGAWTSSLEYYSARKSCTNSCLVCPGLHCMSSLAESPWESHDIAMRAQAQDLHGRCCGC